MQGMTPQNNKSLPLDGQIMARSAGAGFKDDDHSASVKSHTSSVQSLQTLDRIALPITFPVKLERKTILSDRFVYLNIDATSDTLALTLQDTSMLQVCWRTEFKAHYIEEITQKTGRRLQYEEFLVLLDRSLSGQDGQVFIDLLGAQDL